MNNPLLITSLAIFPQTLLLFYAPLGMVGAKTTLRRIIVPSLFVAIIVAVTRSTPILFGWHIPIFLSTYVIILYTFRFASLLGSLAAVALSFFLVVLGDILLLAPFLTLLGTTYEMASDSTWLHVAMGWLESFFLVITAMLVKWRSFVLLPIENSRAKHIRRESSIGKPRGDI